MHDQATEHTVAGMSTPAVRQLLAHLRRRHAEMDDRIRALEDELRMRSWRDENRMQTTLDALRWDAMDGQSSLFELGASLLRAQAR